MRYYAIFYTWETRLDGSHYWDEPCGDRTVMALDGRLCLEHMREIAAAECKLRRFDGWQLWRGNNLLNLFALTAAVQPLERSRA